MLPLLATERSEGGSPTERSEGGRVFLLARLGFVVVWVGVGVSARRLALFLGAGFQAGRRSVGRSVWSWVRVLRCSVAAEVASSAFGRVDFVPGPGLLSASSDGALLGGAEFVPMVVAPWERVVVFLGGVEGVNACSLGGVRRHLTAASCASATHRLVHCMSL